MIMINPKNAVASRVSLLAICYYKSIMYCIFAVISLYIDNKVLGTLCVFSLFLSGRSIGEKEIHSNSQYPILEYGKIEERQF